MFVCVCKAVREADIDLAVGQGVRTMRALAEVKGCSTNCGKCGHAVREALARALERHPPMLQVVPSGRAA